jgi:hypothetical protein
MVNKRSKKNQNQKNANANANANKQLNVNANKQLNVNVVNNRRKSKKSSQKRRKGVQKQQRSKGVQKQQRSKGVQKQQRSKGVQKKQLKRRRSLNRTNQRNSSKNNNRKRTRKNSTKRRKRQRGGYSGLDYGTYPGSVKNGIWSVDWDSNADAGIFGSDYKVDILKGAEVGVRSQFEGTELSEDDSVFDTVAGSEGKMSEKEAEQAVTNRVDVRKETSRTDAVLKELGDLSAIERKYHDAYDRYDTALTNSAGEKSGVKTEDLETLTKYGADNVNRAGVYSRLEGAYTDDSSDIGKQIHDRATDLNTHFGREGSVAPAKNYPPPK